MQSNTRMVVAVLVLVGVYLFGVMAGAVGLPIARGIGGVIMGMHGAPERGYAIGMMGNGYVDAQGGMPGGRGPGSEYRLQQAPDSAYPDCPRLEQDGSVPDQESSSTPRSGYSPRGMMPPGTW